MKENRWGLAGRRALVTGGTKGIGEAVAQELLSLGARVTIVARNPDDVAGRTERWTAEGYPAFGVVADVATASGRATTLEQATAAMGGIDILINNVGTNLRKPSLDFTEGEFAHIVNTNLTTAWEMCRLTAPYLARENGSVVNIGSVAGTVSVGSGGPYAITKAALDQLCRYLAVEWATLGIRVNNVNPWYTRTPLASPVLNDTERAERILARTPNGRIAEPEDVAGLVAFLCLPVARHITGQTIAVDGGFLANGRFDP
ncbi:MAG: SDR family oxidoreductase [Capsulimonadales bacterium]|nr:SDR family oxidoreductase [Capsulimonadales bacterium]